MPAPGDPSPPVGGLATAAQPGNTGPTGADGAPGPATARTRRRDLIAHPGFGRLLAVRLAAQWGDGVFQAALGGAVLFNPERQSDPVLVALGFAVILLPYSVVGPFAGALLDRWDRRRVLVVAGALRAVLTLVTAAVVGAGVTGPGLYLSALATVGVSRFIQSGLSAALPHVVTPRRLVAANSLVTTSGAIAAAIGAGCAFAVAGLLGVGNGASGTVAAAAVVGSLVIVGASIGFVRGSLGPDERSEATRALRAVAGGLADGAGAARRAAGVVAAFWAVAAHRLAFGVATLVMLLLLRGGLASTGPLPGGVAGLGEIVVAVAAGLGVAAVATPWLTGRLGRPATVRIMLVLAAAALAVTALSISLPALLAAAFVLGLVGQAIKLCSDAAVQREVEDSARGRVFALSDTVFNVTYVAAVAGAALVSPPDGRSPLLLAAAAALYLGGLVVHEVALRLGTPVGDTRGPHGGIQPTEDSSSTVSAAPSPSVSASSTSHRGSARPDQT